MPYLEMNTIWNPSLNQQSIPVAFQVHVYQPIQTIGQAIQQLPFQGMPFQVQPTV